jgi:hypothetical protein
MAFITELLESRTLFAVTIPPASAAAYAKVAADITTLKADAKAITVPLAADNKRVLADIKKLGKNTNNAALAAELQGDVATLAQGDKGPVASYINKILPTMRALELAKANFSAKPILANGHKLVQALNAADVYVNAQTDPRVQDFQNEIENASEDMTSTLTALATANPSATQLNKDIDAVNTLSTHVSDDAFTTLDDITTFVNT